MPRASVHRLVAALAVLLLAGCGSTVAPGARGSADGPAAAELAAPGSELGTDTGVGEPGVGAPGTSAALGAGSSTRVTGSTPRTTAAGPTGSSAPAGSRGSTPAGASSTGDGLKAGAPVEVGIAYKEGLDEAGQASGFTLSTADPRAVYDAVIDEINRTGGLNGHPMKPVYVELPAQTSETAASIDQRQCSAWTEDHKVVAVATGGASTEVLPACLQKKGIPFLFVTGAVTEAQTFQRYPLMHHLYPGQYRAVSAWVDALAQQRWFDGPATKIGMLRYDSPDQARIAEQVFKPALARHGLKVEAEAAVDRNASDGGLAAGKSALLNFQSKGVTHLMPLDADGNMTLFGMKLAEGNGYHPRWALTSYVLPYIQQTNNQSQLNGAAGLGWAPTIDVDEANDPGAPPALTRCLDLMRRKGIQTSDRTSVFQAAYSCDLLFTLQAVANRASGLTGPGIGAAFAGLRTFDSAAFAGISFRSDRRDGVDKARYFVFDNGCLCFRYTTKTFGM